MEEFGPGGSFVHDYLIAGQNCSASVPGMLWDEENHLQGVAVVSSQTTSTYVDGRCRHY